MKKILNKKLVFCLTALLLFFAFFVPSVTIAANQSPIAKITANQKSGADYQVQFNPAGSIDPDGSIYSYIWDFGDGSPHVSESSPTHIYSAPNTYNVILNLQDNLGANGSTQKPVTVKDQAPANVIPPGTSSTPSNVTVPKTSACGNGIVEATLVEQCDDGNNVSCDGCSSTCKKEVKTNGGYCPSNAGNLSASSPSGTNLMTELIGRLKQLIVLAAFLMFLLSIFYYTTSGGDTKKIGKAKEFLASAITALIALALVQIFIPKP